MRRKVDDVIIEALDRTLDAIGYDEEAQIRVFTRADGREVVLIQANAFSISRLYTTGRPDGKRIEGYDSYFDRLQARLKAYQEEHGSDEGFSVEPDEWRALFAEAHDRYIRYLFFSSIRRWADVERDTRTNLTLCDGARGYANDDIAWSIYQYKGYILMMNTMAKAELAFERRESEEADEHITRGMENIGAYCRECLLAGHPEAEAITREHWLGNILKYREEQVLAGRLPNASREDTSNIV